MKWIRLTGLVLASLAVTHAGCLDPTEVTLVITTDLDCQTAAEDVTISLGADAENAAPSAATPSCVTGADGQGHYGTVVLVPASADGSATVRVVAGIKQSADKCHAATYGKGEGLPPGVGCVVARRRVAFVRHQPLTLPVNLEGRCVNVPCDVDQTCDNGHCVNSTIDGNACAANPASCVPAPPAPMDTGPRVLAPTGVMTAGSGLAQQHKLVYAQADGRYWLFYFDADDTNLKVRSSPDLSTWTDQPPLTLPMTSGGDGRDFSVAYASLNGTDVVHAILSLRAGETRNVYHVRAVISGGAIHFDPVAELSPFSTAAVVPLFMVAGPPSGCDPDGPSVLIAGDGHVVDATGWSTNAPMYTQYCDFNVFRSINADDGTSWSNAFQFSVRIAVNGVSNAHMLVPLAGGDALGGWDQPQAPPVGATSLVSAASAQGGSWPTSGSNAFPTGVHAANDWSYCRISPTLVHAVRRRLDSANKTFDHVVFDGTTWKAGSALGDDPGVAGSGVTLLSNGSSVAVFTIGADAASSVRYATFTGTSWSAWQTLAGTPAKRALVSGIGCEETDHPVVIWTEGGSSTSIVGAPFAF